MVFYWRVMPKDSLYFKIFATYLPFTEINRPSEGTVHHIVGLFDLFIFSYFVIVGSVWQHVIQYSRVALE